MKVLLIAHGVFFDPARVVTGNSVRAYYLAKGLLEACQNVVYVYPQNLAQYAGSTEEAQTLNIEVQTYADSKHLASIIAWEEPDILLVAYWELLADIPDRLDIPVVLDLVAPRLLEALFQQERDLKQEIKGMLDYFPRVDFFLVGNERQRHLLVPWLIMAGIDCTEHLPIATVPICTQPGTTQPTPPGGYGPWRFVSGGVSWPWRRTKVWFDSLVQALSQDQSKRGRLDLFSGGYMYAEDQGVKGVTRKDRPTQDDIVKGHDLLPYHQLQDFLASKCHIGVELADRNIEREYSQSFRAMEFMRSGLPLICNDYLQMSDLVMEYDAGWTIHSPEQLSILIPSIMNDPEQWHEKSENALRLVEDKFSYHRCVAPLVSFIHDPVRPIKSSPVVHPVVHMDSNREKSDQEIGSRHAPIKKAMKTALLSVAGKILCTIKARAENQQNIVMVTRSDIIPTDHGAAVKIDRTAAALSRYAQKVYVVTDDRTLYYTYAKGKRAVHKYPFWLRIIAPLRSIVHKRAKGKGIPEQDAFLYYPLFDFSYILRTLFIAVHTSAHIFQAEFPAFSRPCLWGRSLLGGMVLLTEHNVEYQRLKDQHSDLSWAGYNFVRQTELMLCNQVDQVITVSKKDKEQLIHDGVQDGQIAYIPHGIDLDAFHEPESFDVRSIFNVPSDQPLLVYHGTYLYPPNMEAVTIMAEEIMPLLRQWGIKARLLAVGPHPPASSPWPDVVFTGSVERVAPYLRAADMAVVPLRQGGGTRMKILDYFAAGLPVVSTAKGMEGIQVTNGQQAMIAEETGLDFARVIYQLLVDPARAKRIARQGREFVQQLDWTVIGQKYFDLMR